MVAEKISDKQFVILNRGCQLPLFCMYSFTKNKEYKFDMRNVITIECIDKVNRIINFLVNNFVLSQEDIDMMVDKQFTWINAEFMNMRNRALIGFKVDSLENNQVRILVNTTNLEFIVKLVKE
mmetsp:Transcript_58727/g.127527  ORF Transcript_58727/g.127527 Transcript_58727/m.127527 type:complete len:123 (+) Transcript_58727:634-1002(+)